MLLCTCGESNKKLGEPKIQSIQIIFQNIPVDSCSVRINHIITGREVFYTAEHNLAEPLNLNLGRDDMYIMTISWPRTYVSHRSFRNNIKQEGGVVDRFELMKPIYIAKNTQKQFVISLTNSDRDILELEGTLNVQFQNENCETCDVADEYWKIFDSFFKRKEHQADSLKQLYFKYVDSFLINEARGAYLKLEEFKRSHVRDDKLDKELQEKVQAYPESPISTFFLFYQLYNHRQFPKFRKSFESLNGEARKSRYYKMVQKQYKESL